MGSNNRFLLRPPELGSSVTFVLDRVKFRKGMVQAFY